MKNKDEKKMRKTMKNKEELCNAIYNQVRDIEVI